MKTPMQELLEEMEREGVVERTGELLENPETGELKFVHKGLVVRVGNRDRDWPNRMMLIDGPSALQAVTVGLLKALQVFLASIVGAVSHCFLHCRHRTKLGAFSEHFVNSAHQSFPPLPPRGFLTRPVRCLAGGAARHHAAQVPHQRCHVAVLRHDRDQVTPSTQIGINKWVIWSIAPKT